MTRVARLAAAAVSAVVGVGVLSACTATSPNAAVVNGTAIKQATVLREMHALSASKDFVAAFDLNAPSPDQYLFGTGTASATYTQSFASAVIYTDIQAALVHNEVVRRHIEPSSAEVAAATAAAQQQFPTGVFLKFPGWFQQEYKLRAAEAAALGKALGPVATTSAAVKDFFTKNPEDFISAQCVSDIIVPTRSEADKIRADLAAGATFAAAARLYSTDAQSSTKGGDLGCNAPAYDNSPLDIAERTVVVNQLSQPVYIPPAAPSSAPVTPGWYVILVRSRKLQALDATNSGRITQYLHQVTAMQVFLDAAVTAAKVSVNPGYGTWDPILDRVTAPLAPGVTAGVPSAASP